MYRCIQLMYTKCMQNVYHILTNFCIHFVYKIKRTMLAKFCIQNVYKKLSNCSKHFVYIHFAYIWKQMFVEIQDIFCIQTFCIHFVYILRTKCIQKFVEMRYTFCIHFVYINFDLQKAYIIIIMYRICRQNLYKMYIQITVCRMDLLFQHILIHLLCTF